MDLHVICNSGTHYIIEMQAQRHLMFDERVIFYACSTFSRQLSEKELQTDNWYLNLKPVIALQVLDYDTNLVKGITPIDMDTLVTEVSKHPMKEGHFLKHFYLQDVHSGQKNDILQMIQLELPRAEISKNLYPPSKDFTLTDWWISILRHSHQYTSDIVEKYHDDKVMPDEIYEAFKRLELQKWNPREVGKYQNDIFHKDIYCTALAVEKREGEKIGIAKGEKIGITKGEKIGIAKGEKIGIANSRETIARTMKAARVSIAKIATFTGLSESAIKKL